MKKLLAEFYFDEKSEGDISKFHTSFVVEALKNKWIKICACSRSYKNAKLTPKGLKEARKIYGGKLQGA